MNKDEYLRVGEVIELKEGMTISAEIEQRFIYANCPTSTELVKTTIRIGQEYNDGKGNTYSTKKYKGKYVVVETKTDGGSRSDRDYYPDGHHVFAQKLKKDGSYSMKAEKINFYQSGCFTNTILPENTIKVTELEMERTFVPKKKKI